MKQYKIGDWVTMCCCQDAFKIETQEMLEEANEDTSDSGLSYTLIKLDNLPQICSCSEKESCPLFNKIMK